MCPLPFVAQTPPRVTAADARALGGLVSQSRSAPQGFPTGGKDR